VPILELHAVSKHFGAIHALNEVDLTLESGEVLGLMGDNGAGKSTLVKVVAGNFPPTHGEIRIGGETVHFHKPVEARQKGVEVVYQDLALCNNLSMARKAGELFSELKSETRPRDLVRQMSGGQRQAVAIARTRLSKARMVLMDEPTAAISVRQVAEVLDLIRRLKDSGMAIMLISHRMPDVFAVCDRVMVMRRGRKVADKPIKATSPEEVTGLITGAIHTA
jgi:simple sugar transport system ATP-binding protein